MSFTKLSAAGVALPDDAIHGVIVRQDIGGISLEWSRDDVTGEAVDWDDARRAVEDFRLGGHSDWRLPTVEELFLLADRSRYEPAVDTTYFPTCRPRAYWTSTADASSPLDCAWYVSFGGGGSGWYNQDFECFVRAVRSAEGRS